MNRKKQMISGLVIALFLLASNTFAILDTIVLQHGIDGYYGNKDAHRRGKGSEDYLSVGSC